MSDASISSGPRKPPITAVGPIAWARANPKQANFGTPGPGTLPHFLGDAFSRAGNLGLMRRRAVLHSRISISISPFGQ